MTEHATAEDNASAAGASDRDVGHTVPHGNARCGNVTGCFNDSLRVHSQTERMLASPSRKR
jgi:hypothetical protein